MTRSTGGGGHTSLSERKRSRAAGAKASLVGLMLIGNMLTTSQASFATHLLCGTQVPVFQPGVGGVVVGVDTSANWRGICIGIKNGSGEVVAYMSVSIGLLDPEPGATGKSVGFAICTSQAGDCHSLIGATGAEVGTPVACPSGIGLCIPGAASYVNGGRLPVATTTGVAFVVSGTPVTQGPGIVVGVGCPACVHDTKVYVGRLDIYANSEFPHSINVCAQAGSSAGNCPAII